MPDQPSPRRRFQFRLRTLLIGVTLFCAILGGIGSQLMIVRARRAWLRHLMTSEEAVGTQVLYANIGRDEPNVVRRWLGDRAIDGIALSENVSEEDRVTTIRLFPESNVIQEHPIASKSDHLTFHRLPYISMAGSAQP